MKKMRNFRKFLFTANNPTLFSYLLAVSANCLTSSHVTHLSFSVSNYHFFAKQYPNGTLHADDGRLFCTSCNVTLDHTRKGTIDRHLLTPMHTQKRKSLNETNDTRAKKQATITGAFKAVSESRNARNHAQFE